jgi:Mg-chelatase subunit ChlD
MDKILRHVQLLLFVFVLTFSSVAWSTQRAGMEGMDLVLVLDNSGSMKRNDPRLLTKTASFSFIKGLKGDVRIGLIVFDQSVRVLSPLSAPSKSALSTIQSGLKSMAFNGLYTDIPSAIERSIFMLKMSGRPEAKKAIILMTDGAVDTGDKVRDLEKSRWLREDLSLAALRDGIRIFGVAFSEKADYQLMQTLAYKTDGEYYRMFESSDIVDIFNHIEKRIRSARDIQPVATNILPAKKLLQPLAIKPQAPVMPVVSAIVDTVLAAEKKESKIVAVRKPEPSVKRELVVDVAPVTVKKMLIAAENDGETKSSQEPQSAEEQEPQNAKEPAPEELTAEVEVAEVDASVYMGRWVIGICMAGLVLYFAFFSSKKPKLPIKRKKPVAEPQPWEKIKVINDGQANEVIVAVEEESEQKPGQAPDSEEGVDPEHSSAASTRLNRMFFTEDSPSSTRQLQPQASLKDLNGVTGQEMVEITRQHTVIGRRSEYIAAHLGRVVIDKDEISRNHAAIHFRDMAFWLEDLDSANGTFVNSQQIHEKVRVKHGDTVQFCDEMFEFILMDEEDKSNETIMRKA